MTKSIWAFVAVLVLVAFAASGCCAMKKKECKTMDSACSSKAGCANEKK